MQFPKYFKAIEWVYLCSVVSFLGADIRHGINREHFMRYTICVHKSRKGIAEEGVLVVGHPHRRK